jgi:hypothetical protein
MNPQFMRGRGRCNTKPPLRQYQKGDRQEKHAALDDLSLQFKVDADTDAQKFGRLLDALRDRVLKIERGLAGPALGLAWNKKGMLPALQGLDLIGLAAFIRPGSSPILVGARENSEEAEESPMTFFSTCW